MHLIPKYKKKNLSQMSSILTNTNFYVYRYLLLINLFEERKKKSLEKVVCCLIIAIFKYRFQEATFNVFMEIVCFNVFFLCIKERIPNRNRNRIKQKNYESISYSQRVVYSRLECFYISNLRNDKSIFKWQRATKIISPNECSSPANQYINLTI